MIRNTLLSDIHISQSTNAFEGLNLERSTYQSLKVSRVYKRKSRRNAILIGSYMKYKKTQSLYVTTSNNNNYDDDHVST